MKTAAMLLGLLAVFAGAPADDLVRFYWCAQTATGPVSSVRYSLVEKEHLTLKSGDRLQFYVVAARDAHGYIVHLLPDGRLDTLFPKGGTSATLVAGRQHYLPARSSWFTLDGPTGRDRIILLVSPEPLVELEGLLAANGRAAGTDRKLAADAVIAEIARLRKAFPMPVESASRPALMAGSFRSAALDPAQHAIELTAPRLFARTYIIDHK
jgi:hypothetical protein